LGSIALAFTAASSKADQAAIADLVASEGRAGFAVAWLRHKGLDWAVEYLEPAAASEAAAVLEETGS
jgi:type IV secretion system protein TrbE